jgi:hypothetical protein
MPRGRPKAKPKEEAPATESLAANAIEGPCEEVSRKLVIDFSDEVKGLLRAIIVAHEALAREAEACKEAYIKAHSAGPIRKFEVPIADVFIEPSIDGNPPSEKKKEEEPNVPVPEPVPAEPGHTQGPDGTSRAGTCRSFQHDRRRRRAASRLQVLKRRRDNEALDDCRLCGVSGPGHVGS